MNTFTLVAVRCGIVESETIAVDTPKDLERVRKLYEKEKNMHF